MFRQLTQVLLKKLVNYTETKSIEMCFFKSEDYNYYIIILYNGI